MDCVIDVSFAGCWFLDDESNPEGRSVLSNYEKGIVQFHVPQLWVYELPNALLMAHRLKRLDAEKYAKAKQAFASMHFIYHEQADSICGNRIFDFAEKFELTAYDAGYLELADRLQFPLLTLDKELLAAAKRKNISTSLNFKK